MSDSKGQYQKGYRAGLKKGRLEAEAEMAAQRRERVYMQCLETVLKHCSGWSIAGKQIDNAEGYCTLARIFADHAITNIERCE